jgi:hypothetical protein
MGRIVHQGVFEDAAGLRGLPTRENQFVFNKPVESLTKFGVPRLTRREPYEVRCPAADALPLGLPEGWVSVFGHVTARLWRRREHATRITSQRMVI